MKYFEVPELPVVFFPADSRHKSGHVRGPWKLIVIHATAGTNSRNWLSVNPASNVSIHTLISKSGQNTRIVPDDEIANHVGYSRMGNTISLNGQALGIELENLNTGKDPYPQAQIDACAAQIVSWWSQFGYLPYVSHASVDTAGKTDPAGFPWEKLNHAVTACLTAALTPKPIIEG